MKESKLCFINSLQKSQKNFNNLPNQRSNLNKTSFKNYVLKSEYFGNKTISDVRNKENPTRSFCTNFKTNDKTNFLVSYYIDNYQEKEEKIEFLSNSSNQKKFPANLPETSIVDNTKSITEQNQPSEGFDQFENKNVQTKQNKWKSNLKPITLEEARNFIQSIESKNGCRYYQTKILKNPTFANDYLYPLLKPFMLRLIKNEYGNFLYKDFIDVLNKQNLNHFLNFIYLYFDIIAYSNYGAKVIQKLLEKINLEDKFGTKIFQKITEKLEGRVSEMSVDINTSHIIQKFLTSIKSPYTNFIHEEVCQSFLAIATSKLGCCVVEKCFQYSDKNQKEKISELVLNNAFSLIYHPFGNYILQNFIVLGEENLVVKLFELLSENLMLLCKQKYSSNVVEKFFEIKNQKLINKFACSLLSVQERIIYLIFDEYGNFIIQKIIRTTNDKYLKKQIFDVVKYNIENINSLYYGQKFLQNINDYLKVLD